MGRSLRARPPACVWIHGRFYRHGTRAKGWFKVLIHPFSFGCTTGKVFWKAALA